MKGRPPAGDDPILPVPTPSYAGFDPRPRCPQPPLNRVWPWPASPRTKAA
jgi:hypothetical protein